MKHIILITGGQRSGKSAFAEKMALAMAENPVYMATAHIWDEEFRQRVLRHRQNRRERWQDIEEERQLGNHPVEGRVVVIDCVTLWCTNFFSDANSDAGQAFECMKKEFDRFTEQEATFIFVTNEIGLGGVSENKMQRRFTDLQGWTNQYIASKADEVFFMISGISWKIK